MAPESRAEQAETPAPEVTFVVVNWNTAPLLALCLQSLAEHGRPPGGAEVIVVDNGSTDGSKEMVRRDFPSVRLIDAGENLGFGRANNLAFEHARGEQVFLINSDAQLTPGALDVMSRYLREHSDVAAVGPQLRSEDGTRQNSFDNVPTLLTEICNKTLLKHLFPRRFPSKRFPGTEPMDVESLIGAAMLVRREVVERVGGFDPRFFFFLEETDWCLRMRRAGYRVVHLPAVDVLHRQGASKDRAPARAWIEYYRSTYRFFRKHHGVVSAVVLRVSRPAKLVVNLAFTLLLCLATLLLARRVRRRARVYATLLLWHLLFCPGSMGLPRSAPTSGAPAG